MQINLGTKRSSKLEETLDFIFSTDNKTFKKIEKALKDPAGELDIRYQDEIDDPQTTQELIDISTLLLAIKKIDLKNCSPEQERRIEVLKKCRSKKDLEKALTIKHSINKKEASEIISVLDGKKSFAEFLEEKSKSIQPKRTIFSFFRRKKELPEGKDSIVQKYTDLLDTIMSNEIPTNFSIEEFDPENFAKIKTVIFEKNEAKSHSIVLGKNDEPDWQINPELKEYVYHEMPEELSPEEKAMWIYMKLCKTFRYDDRQWYDRKNNEFDKNFLEDVKPSSKLICFDFSRIYAKFINEALEGSIEAKVIGGSGHFLVELVGQDSLAKVEATNGNISHSNEFFKMRMGMQIEGVKKIYDPNSKYEKAIEKVTPLVNPDLQNIDKYMKMLETIRAQEELDKDETRQDDLFGKLSALLETMKEHDVSETEAMMGILAFSSKGFLDQNLEKSWVKQNVEDEIRGIDGRSAIIISNPSSGKLYVVNGQNMTVEEVQKEELIERFNAGKYEYRDSKHIIHAIDGEVPIPEDKGKGERNDNVR